MQQQNKILVETDMNAQRNICLLQNVLMQKMLYKKKYDIQTRLDHKVNIFFHSRLAFAMPEI